jgi:hypothetical protein
MCIPTDDQMRYFQAEVFGEIWVALSPNFERDRA